MNCKYYENFMHLREGLSSFRLCRQPILEHCGLLIRQEAGDVSIVDLDENGVQRSTSGREQLTKRCPKRDHELLILDRHQVRHREDWGPMR